MPNATITNYKHADVARCCCCSCLGPTAFRQSRLLVWVGNTIPWRATLVCFQMLPTKGLTELLLCGDAAVEGDAGCCCCPSAALGHAAQAVPY